MSSARTMSDTQRKEVLDRLILERQTKPSLSSAPSTESLADKRERVQQLLRERRASQGRSLLPFAMLHIQTAHVLTTTARYIHNTHENTAKCRWSCQDGRRQVLQLLGVTRELSGWPLGPSVHMAWQCCWPIRPV